MNDFLKQCYKNKRVLLTGHTGFKGSWLSLWLLNLGAKVFGYSLAPKTNPNHYNLLELDMPELIADIRDSDALKRVFVDFKPEIIFHLAAQPLVRASYQNPVETFSVNVLGTANILEFARNSSSVQATVVITTDKCYENREWIYGYREVDRLGGHDPYSASKACTELVAKSFYQSFGPENGLVATCRAGNVIGGGDWAEDRLIPDVARAYAKGEKVSIRNPDATRPWQHVLDPLHGYLMLGAKLLKGETRFANAWNFGPDPTGQASVGKVMQLLTKKWNVKWTENRETNAPHETGLLSLDCAKARNQLGWRPVWNLKQALEYTAEWYRAYYNSRELITASQLQAYCKMLEVPEKEL